jgi:Flp pilus assembly protein TadD
MSLVSEQGSAIGALDQGGQSDEAMMRALVEGSMRKELGLQPGDLRIGLNVAKNLLDRGSAAEALRIYIALVLCAPTEIDYQVGLANCALQLGEHHLALQSASAIVALAPRDPRGYFLSGRACLGMGALKEAEEDLRDAVEHGRNARDATIVNLANTLLGKFAASST